MMVVCLSILCVYCVSKKPSRAHAAHADSSKPRTDQVGASAPLLREARRGGGACAVLLLCLRRVLLVQLLRVLPTGAESCTADPDQSLKVDPKVRSRSKDLAVCDSWSWRRCLVEKAFVRRPGFAGRRPALVGPRAPTMASRLLALAMLGSGKRSRCPCCPPSPAERSSHLLVVCVSVVGWCGPKIRRVHAVARSRSLLSAVGSMKWGSGTRRGLPNRAPLRGTLWLGLAPLSFLWHSDSCSFTSQMPT